VDLPGCFSFDGRWHELRPFGVGLFLMLPVSGVENPRIFDID
jgi:hypothetical protein